MHKIIQAKRMAAVLSSSFRERNVEISHGEILDIVALQFGEKNWNALSAKLKRSVPIKSGHEYSPILVSDEIAPTDFQALFPEAELPCNVLAAGDETRHPFPNELRNIPELVPWRKCWEANPISKHDKFFFPPLFPGSCLMSPNPTYELRRDWRINGSGKALPTKAYHFSQGFCCVLAKDKNHKVIGAAFWKWWGIMGRVNGVCYGLYLLTKTGWLHVIFELRANHALPSPGPILIRGDNERDLQQIRAGLRELSKLKVFRYAS